MRDPLGLHARLAVSDGFTRHPAETFSTPSRTGSAHDTAPGHHALGFSGGPQGRQASPLRSDPIRG